MTEEFQIITHSTPEWEHIYKIAQEDQTHELWENYQKINLDDYIAMIVYLQDGIPGAFHGVYNNGRWPDNVARIGNRAYIAPHLREQKNGFLIAAKNIKFALDNYDKWGKDVLFMSKPMQYNNVETSWKKFQMYSKWWTKSTGYEWVCDDRIYQSCPAECKDCYQFCTWYDPKNLKNTLDIKSLEAKEWYNLS